MRAPSFNINNAPSLALVAWLIALICGACVDNVSSPDFDGDGAPPRPDEDGPWAIAVVGTDYMSTSISILDPAEQELFREGVIHSGSTESGLSTALSGDVVLPRRYNPENRLVLIDRFPNSVLTFLDPEDFSVSGQLSVATGFASNPHDFLWLDTHKAYVTRYEVNPRPGGAVNDGGDDILIVDPTDHTILGSVPLTSFADDDLLARPDQMAEANDLVWISLNHLSRDFGEAGGGLLVAVDPTTDKVAHRLTIPEARNCTALVAASAKNALYVSCSGLFISEETHLYGWGTVVAVDLAVDPPTASFLRRASADDPRPYGFDLDFLPPKHLLAVRFGDLARDVPDLAVVIDVDNGEERVLHTASSPYGMGGILADPERGLVYVGDADSQRPRVYVYKLDGDNFKRIGEIETHPQSGLAPRHLRFY
ncbi:MAG: hypothetical protein C4523_21065 [Myxococcales bacterium]|nr:MAG: hypothetical protein C4523_21065 [Myxococcales bacterium]